MSTNRATAFAVNCSFCNKDNRQVKRLIAGPGVYICDECIGLCNTILDEETNGAAESAPAASLDEAPVEHLVMILGAMARTARSMEDRLGEWASKLEQRGVPLSTIASALGITEAETRERFDL